MPGQVLDCLPSLTIADAIRPIKQLTSGVKNGIT